MATIIWIIVGIVIGAVAGLSYAVSERRSLENELEFERRFGRSRAKGPGSAGPVPSDPDVGDFLSDHTYTIRKGDTAEKIAKKLPVGARFVLPPVPVVGSTIMYTTEADAKPAPRIKNEDAAKLYEMIAELGPMAWISKTTANVRLGWGFRRYKQALEYLQRNRYIKKTDEKKNRGAQFEIKE